MKSSTILAVLVVTPLMMSSSGAAATGVVDQLPEVVPGALRRQARAFSEKPCDGTRQSACTSCNVIKSCILADASMDSDNPLKRCPKNNQFCSMSVSAFGAVCQKTPDTSVDVCATAVPDFKCTGSGYYPDAYTCQYYYICAGAGKTPDFLICPDGYRFSSKTKACVQANVPCPTFTCKADDPNFVYQPHMYDSQYYVYCEFDTTRSPPSVTNTYVFSCGEGATYNPTTGRCVYTCTKEGLFANTANANQYYQCSRMGARFVYTEKVCPAGKYFDVGKCIDNPTVPTDPLEPSGPSNV